MINLIDSIEFHRNYFFFIEIKNVEWLKVITTASTEHLQTKRKMSNA